MFTGLITHQGKIKRVDEIPSGKRMAFEVFSPWSEALQEGESIAVNGTCLTALSVQPGFFEAELSLETLEKTSFKNLEVNSPVHFERALRANDRLGGHLVQGHVDGICQISKIENLSEFHHLHIKIPESLMFYTCSKGSVTIDGVSLTINEISPPNTLHLMIIPHTWKNTIFSEYKEGQLANIEIDMMAKQIAKLSENYFLKLAKEKQI